MHILNQHLPELEELQKASNNYITRRQNDKEATNAAIDIDGQQSQSNIIRLKTRLADLQQQVASVTPATLGVVIQVLKPQQLSPAMKILLSFFAGLFLAVIILLGKSMVANDV